MHVLLVEDDEDTRDTIRYFLERAGHVVRSVSNGLEALGSVRHEPPDIMLLDVVIPALNGYEVCRLIKEDIKRGPGRRRMPIVLLTARKVRDPRREGFIRDWTGADAVIYKPFGRRTLLTVMTQLLAVPVTEAGTSS